MDKTQNTLPAEQNEWMDIIEQIKTEKKILIRSLIIFFLLGVLIVLLSPKQYNTEISLLAETNAKSGSGSLLSNLGGGSGLDVGSLIGLELSNSGKETLKPELYPDVVNSTTFLIDILKSKIDAPEGTKKISVSEYLQDYTRPAISEYIGAFINLFKSGDDHKLFTKTDQLPLKLTQEESDIIKSLAGLIDLVVIKSGGGLTGGDSKIIKLSVEAQDPDVSAQLAELIVNNLKQYIIDYNTNKVKKDLTFIKARYHEAQADYYKAQEALAEYDDSHTNIVLESVRTRRTRLVTEHDLASSIYKSLAQKLEQAKILVQEKTPVFTVIEAAKVPIHKSKPKRLLILISMIFIGIFAGITYLFTKDYIKKLWILFIKK